MLLSYMVNFGRWLKIFFSALDSKLFFFVLKEITVLSNIDLRVRFGMLSFPQNFARKFSF